MKNKLYKKFFLFLTLILILLNNKNSYRNNLNNHPLNINYHPLNNQGERDQEFYQKNQQHIQNQKQQYLEELQTGRDFEQATNNIIFGNGTFKDAFSILKSFSKDAPTNPLLNPILHSLEKISKQVFSKNLREIQNYNNIKTIEQAVSAANILSIMSSKESQFKKLRRTTSHVFSPISLGLNMGKSILYEMYKKPYYVVIGSIAGIYLYQHWKEIKKRKEKEKETEANNAILIPKV